MTMCDRGDEQDHDVCRTACISLLSHLRSLAIAISVFKHNSESSMMTVNHFWRGLECSRDEAVLYGAEEVGFEALSEKCQGLNSR